MLHLSMAQTQLHGSTSIARATQPLCSLVLCVLAWVPVASRDLSCREMNKCLSTPGRVPVTDWGNHLMRVQLSEPLSLLGLLAHRWEVRYRSMADSVPNPPVEGSLQCGWWLMGCIHGALRTELDWWQCLFSSAVNTGGWGGRDRGGETSLSLVSLIYFPRLRSFPPPAIYIEGMFPSIGSISIDRHIWKIKHSLINTLWKNSPIWKPQERQAPELTGYYWIKIRLDSGDGLLGLGGQGSWFRKANITETWSRE